MIKRKLAFAKAIMSSYYIDLDSSDKPYSKKVAIKSIRLSLIIKDFVENDGKKEANMDSINRVTQTVLTLDKEENDDWFYRKVIKQIRAANNAKEAVKARKVLACLYRFNKESMS